MWGPMWWKLIGWKSLLQLGNVANSGMTSIRYSTTNSVLFLFFRRDCMDKRGTFRRSVRNSSQTDSERARRVRCLAQLLQPRQNSRAHSPSASLLEPLLLPHSRKKPLSASRCLLRFSGLRNNFLPIGTKCHYFTLSVFHSFVCLFLCLLMLW